ncbi:MAG: galactitol-1-phosphate 5-dehydrogenase [candidate division NC10 bacterium RIFCSPLOWO2_12_FULL_66_18]|nr:MAG: galactitol-1-phosphate 5-dehydrogenase [candidate division NC10 bacterium RIFCSPLOWO2_02_FULL_66_22]OGB98301.1 MAG: galactitol-1-phosphate 5-dehydrogenase [candidate division NC10 bacterium RIFCSPLOWO2_12_FULL_66_18]
MKALVHTAPLQFDLRDVPQPQPGEDEVLVRVKACGICGSDVHGYTGSTGRRIPPIIMGHEAAGVVEAVGRNVRDLAAGDRITFDSTVYCNQCPACRQGRMNLCQNRKVLGVSTPAFRRDGAMAEYVVVPWWITHRLPDAVSFEEAALIEPAAVSLHAARITPIEVNDVVAVVGAGQIGLFAMQAARVKGAGIVIALDVKEERLKLARQLGADVTINPAASDVAAEMRRAVGRPDADVVLEAVGTETSVRLAMDLTTLGGNLTLIGNVTPRIQVNLQDIVSRELTIRGSCAIAGEYRACLDLMASGRIQAKPLISRIVPLAEGQAAFDALHRGEPGLVKIVLRP